MMLLSIITQLIDEREVIKTLDPVNSLSMCENIPTRMQMARDLLGGEIRILKSASAWLKYYCATLTT
ncbi:ribulose-1,5 bisphosphate carboxylase/oxygenase large subunit N-methyltransferase, chloroplastic [Quillaja saponaria]|uniref:Ribulose-1,5 bisphosphate carboxylase/oxygenase large subunit N-methyltransferase, chloroplastic n=1 Tax=Quillaja saponaria TaxID=32244 RepID=A0AAD7PYS9_QUISA|nr:ribulose-1,5 bisphosphate carboxylase/oxygenase large subunit N-methyltransferase, chloroplastic [Quillaja saponaria]